MTIIEQIKAEVERLKATNPSEYNYQNAEGYVWALDDVLSFLSTLKSEKPIEQDGLEEEIESYWKENGPMSHAEYDRLAKCANHFAQWGAEHLKK